MVPTPVTGVVGGNNWNTITIASVADLRVGFPEVISADIPANLLGAGLYCLMVLLHHPQDTFNPPAPPLAPPVVGGINNVDYLVTVYSKATMKYLTVV